MKSKPIIDEFFEDFEPVAGEEEAGLRHRRAITRWRPEAIKSMYDELQESSDRTFGKRLDALIDAAVSRTYAKLKAARKVS